MNRLGNHRIGLLVAVLIFCLPLGSVAQQRIGVILTGDIPHYEAMYEAFVSELGRQLPEGEQPEIIPQRPFPDSIPWSNAARKLIAIDVDLIVTFGSPAARAVLEERPTMPVLYAGVYDPQKARLTGKQVAGCGYRVPLSSLLRYFKQIKRIDALTIVYNSGEEDSVRQEREIAELAAEQGIQVNAVDVRTRDDLARLAKTEESGVFISGSALAHVWIRDIMAKVHEKKQPSAGIFSGTAEEGVIVSLFSPPALQGKKAAAMAAAILKGNPIATVDPEVVRETELVFNLREAESIGLSLPVQLVVEATKVIK